MLLAMSEIEFIGGWKGGSPSKVPFGLRDGQLWFVTDVPTGLACGCRCPDPACDKPLIARNQPSPTRKRAFYFAHAGDAASCGGRESALHRMAKQILLEASHVRLPAMQLPGETVEATRVALQEGTRTEVRLLEGQARPDVSGWTMLDDGRPLAEIHIEVRVSHAVDAMKEQLVAANGLTMFEVDLSQVSDEMVQDREAFTRLVLQEPGNRVWISLRNAALVSALSGKEVIEIDQVCVSDHVIPYKKGDGHWLHTRQAVRSIVAGRAPWLTEIELEAFVGDPAAYRDAAGKVIAHSHYGNRELPVDSKGTRLPYEVGLYLRGSSMSPHKVTLRPIDRRTPHRLPQGSLLLTEVGKAPA